MYDRDIEVKIAAVNLRNVNVYPGEIFCQKCIIFVAHKQTSGETRFFIKFVCHINRSNLRRSFQLQKKLNCFRGYSVR